MIYLPLGVTNPTASTASYIFIFSSYTLTQCFPIKTQNIFQNKPPPSTLVEGFLLSKITNSLGGLLQNFLGVLFPPLIQETRISVLAL